MMKKLMNVMDNDMEIEMEIKMGNNVGTAAKNHCKLQNTGLFFRRQAVMSCVQDIKAHIFYAHLRFVQSCNSMINC